MVHGQIKIRWPHYSVLFPATLLEIPVCSVFVIQLLCSSVSISEEGKGTCLQVCCFKVLSRHVPRNAKRRLLESVTREPMQIICKCVEPIINFHKQ